MSKVFNKACTHCIAVKSHQKCQGDTCKRCVRDGKTCVREEKIRSLAQVAVGFQNNNVERKNNLKDILKELGRISKEDYDYYEKL